MNIDPPIVRALLRLYPAEWHAEYGEEFGALLSREPITPHIFADVVLRATRERFRREGWKACAAALFVLTAIGILVNNTRPFSSEGYWRFLFCWQTIVLSAGCLSVLQNNRTMPFRTAAKAALIGFIPELIVLSMWVTGLFHPLVTPVMTKYGTTLLESRLALLDITFPTAPQPGMDMIPVTTAIVLLGSCVLGFLGGMLGRAISFLSPRLRRSS